jgi:hypothetical protein
MLPVEDTMTLPLELTHIVWDRFGCLEPWHQSWNDQRSYWEDYTAAFCRSNGTEYSSASSNVGEWMGAADRAPFVKMAEALLERLKNRTILNDLDMILLAHWFPDIHLGSSVTNLAMHHLGLSNACGFAISDRGLSAPLFALDCIAKYLRDGRRRALLMVMDQKHLLYKSRLKEALMPDNSACLMLLERRHGPGLVYLGYRRHILRSSESLSAQCLELLNSLALRTNMTSIITSDAQVASITATARITTADPHLVCAAPFVALGENPETNRDYLLLTRDDQCLCGVGFRSQEA